MHRKWFLDAHKSGSLRFYRMQSDYGLVPGRMIQKPSESNLHRLDVSWKPHSDPRLREFVVDSYVEVDRTTGEVMGDADDIAGTFTFNVELATRRLIEVLPGGLSSNVVISTLSGLATQPSSESRGAITKLLWKDAAIAAEEMVCTQCAPFVCHFFAFSSQLTFRLP